MKKSNTLPWYVKLSLAVCGGLLAIAAISVDLVNAYLYGATTTNTMAALAVIVAVAVVLLPMMLELGAPRVLWLLWLACVAATMYFAFQYYYVSAKQNNVAASNAHEVYTSAAEEKTLALQTLKRINAAGDVEELGKLANNADANLNEAVANVAKYCKSRRITDACTTAQQAKTLADTTATLAHNKLSDAKAWHDAKATLAKANETQKKGDVAEKDVDVIALIFALILVQCLAGLSGVATSLGAEALRERAALQASKAKVKHSKPEAPTDGGTHAAVADNVVSITAARWLAERTLRGTGLPGGEAKKNYERFTGQKISAKQFRDALVSLLGPDAIRAKNSGYIIEGYGLKPVTAAEKKAAVC